MPQHLTCVRALAAISHAKIQGDLEGSAELVFAPGETVPGDYSFDIGTAGSTLLLLQAVLPPLAFASERSRLTLRGGTHVPLSPPFHFISEVFVPALRRLGIDLHVSIERYGFYPRGGGKIQVQIEPVSGVKAMNVSERKQIERISGISGVVNLPTEIAVRQKNAALASLSGIGLKADIRLFQGESSGRGTFVFLRADAEVCPAGFSSLGERGKKAESVGAEAANALLDYYQTRACLDDHLADQIVPYLAMARGESLFTVSRITNHLLTNLGVIERFLGVKYRLEGEKGRSGTVAVYP